MLTRETMKGIYALPPLPYTKEKALDEEALRENIRKLCDVGVDAIVPTGTLGEFHTVSWEDHKKLIKILVDETSSGVMTVPGCSGVNTREAIKKTKFAQESGADAVMNVVPFYEKLTKAECIKFYRDVAKACPKIGIIVYNNPSTGRILHDAETFKAIANLPNICGSKEIVGRFSHWLAISRATDLTHMEMESNIVPTMQNGAKGAFNAGWINMSPKISTDIYKACKEGKWGKALETQRKADEMYAPLRNLFGGYHYISAWKARINAFGFLKCGPPGNPFIPVPDKLIEKAREMINEIEPIH